MSVSSLHDLSPQKTEVQGLSIPEYELPAERSKKYAKRWIMGEWDDCKPEEAVAFYLREQADCGVMFREGEMVKSLLDALCIAAYSENQGVPLIHKSGNTTSFRPGGFRSQPEAEFTRLYVHRFFKEFRIQNSELSKCRVFGCNLCRICPRCVWWVSKKRMILI